MCAALWTVSTDLDFHDVENGSKRFAENHIIIVRQTGDNRGQDVIAFAVLHHPTAELDFAAMHNRLGHRRLVHSYANLCMQRPI